MGFGIRHAVESKTAALEIRAYLGIPTPYLGNLDLIHDVEISEIRKIIMGNFDSVFNNFPGVANKFLSGKPYIKLFSDKERETLYFVLTGYKVYSVDRLDEFLEFFCSIIMEEVCRRSVFDISFKIKPLMFED